MVKITVEEKGKKRILLLDKEESQIVADALAVEETPITDLLYKFVSFETLSNHDVTTWKENLYDKFGQERVREILNGERQDRDVRKCFDSFCEAGGKFDDSDRTRCGM